MPMIKKYFFLFFLVLCQNFLSPFQILINAQESQIFKRSDFDLRGPVKSCLVITKYGKEEFEFNEEGLLTKNLTRFNEQDYNVTYYKYSKDILIEKRDEVYRDGIFDKQTSIANFYSIDTSQTKIVNEEIISYTGETLESYEYQYNEDDKLLRIIRSDNNGIDETEVVHTNFKGEKTVTYSQNGIIQKSIRTSLKKKLKQKVVLTKSFLNGDPVKAQEEIFDEYHNIISLKEFTYDLQKKSFTPDKTILYFYDQAGMLSKENIKKGGATRTIEYIYQYDDETKGNWVKQIISPENLFTTRVISYYENDENKEP